MDDLPIEFYQLIRHISSFKNKEEWDKYLQEQIELWNKKQ